MTVLNKKNLDSIATIYVDITVICFLLFNIAPIVSVIKYTPLYSFQKYLGIIGFILMVVDVLSRRFILKNTNNILLMGIILCSIISSIMYRSYGIKGNAFSIVWGMINFLYFSTYVYKVGNQYFKKNAILMYKIIKYIMTTAIVVSFLSFIFLCGYQISVYPNSAKVLTRQGFHEERLFGVFVSINGAATIAAVLLIVGIYYYFNSKSIKRKIMISINNFVYVGYIILSGSRATYYSLLCVMLLALYIYFSDKYKQPDLFKNIMVKIATVIVSVGLVFVTTFIVKEVKIGLSYIPTMTVLQNNQKEYRNAVASFSGVKLYKDNDTKEKHSKKDARKILQRDDVTSQNISNNRFAIWSDYLSVYKEIGLFGLSPQNYSQYIFDHNTDLYIVKHPWIMNPEYRKEKKIYAPHNGYLKTFISSGFIGLGLLVVFLLLNLKNIYKYKITRSSHKNIFLDIAILILVFGLLNTMFVGDLFFVFSTMACIFWLLAGYVMKNTVRDRIE